MGLVKLIQVKTKTAIPIIDERLQAIINLIGKIDQLFVRYCELSSAGSNMDITVHTIEMVGLNKDILTQLELYFRWTSDEYKRLHKALASERELIFKTALENFNNRSRREC